MFVGERTIGSPSKEGSTICRYAENFLHLVLSEGSSKRSLCLTVSMARATAA